jgi:hypothetical protein
MKKILVALLIVAFAVPAIADVAVTAADMGGGQLRITVSPSGGAAVRGVALKLSNTDGATIDATTDATVTQFNTNIDYAFSNAGYAIGDGHCLANPAAAGVLDLATPKSEFSLCAGYLDQGGGQAGVTVDSFFDVFFDLTIDSTIGIALDTLRGGIVGDNLGTVTVQPSQLLVGAPPACVVSQPTVVHTAAVPSGISGRVNGGRSESFTASATSDLGHGLEYQFTWGDGNIGAWGAATQTHTYTYAAAATYNVTVVARCTSPDASVSIPSAPLALTSEPVKSTATFYAVWADFSRPNCWAFRRNCRGDANGGKVGVLWVQTIDLNVVVAGWGKQDPALKLASYDPGTGPIPAICADFNRTKVGVLRVQTNDLNVLVSYWGKVEAQVPVCDQTNYHYWTN